MEVTEEGVEEMEGISEEEVMDEGAEVLEGICGAELDSEVKRKEKTGIRSLKKVIDSIDPGLARAFLPFALRHPRYIGSFIRLSRSFGRCKQVRKTECEKGIMIPPFLILSVTSRCNLGCSGCYARATGSVTPLDHNHDDCQGKYHGSGSFAPLTERGSIIEYLAPTDSKPQRENEITDLNIEGWKSIISQASEIGVFGFVIAGGEPFLTPGILELCLEFPDRLFLILTNGTAIGQHHLKQLKKCSNGIIIVSLEGNQDITDSRRGTGVHTRVMQTLRELRNAGVLTGISATITSRNVHHWMDPKNLIDLLEQDIKLAAFIEYIPLTPNPGEACLPDGGSLPDDEEGWDAHDDHHLMLTPEKRKEFRSYVLSMRKELPMYMIHSPGDEEKFGGCVSAGRGFAHVTPKGDLTPCPVSNIATHNLAKVPVRDALAGELFETIRDNHHLLETEGMPCALFAHPREVDEIARSVGAYRTNVRSK